MVIWDPDGEALPAGQLRSPHGHAAPAHTVLSEGLQPGFSPDWWQRKHWTIKVFGADSCLAAQHHEERA